MMCGGGEAGKALLPSFVGGVLSHKLLPRWSGRVVVVKEGSMSLHNPTC